MDPCAALGRRRKRTMFVCSWISVQRAEGEMMMMYSWDCICLFSLFLVTVT